MRILDNNALNYIRSERIVLRDEYFVTPDVYEEFNVVSDNLPYNAKILTEHNSFNWVEYLRGYQRMLNRYKERSFYNMRGFGDVSILAALHMLERASRSRLPTMHEPAMIVSSDINLRNHIVIEFPLDTPFGASIDIHNEAEYFAL